MKIFFFILFPLTIDAFIEPKTTEKVITQIKGFVNFALQMEESRPLHRDVTFFLYTRKNPSKATKLFVNDRESFYNSTFDATLRTVFVIHGYTDHNERDIIVKLREVLVANIDCNVIVVDWKRLAGFVYFNAAANAILVGNYFKEFLLFIENCGVDLASVHLIGHSLGGQISGIAGQGVNGRVGRITALDPAGPLFEFIYIRNSTESLDKNDAKFVDVIHTAGETFGVMQPIGHADFYPNDGMSPQPGCTNIFTSVSCSHIRSVDFFTESINGTILFLAKRCTKWNSKTLQNCHPYVLIPMGYHTPTNTKGIFYLQTKENAPYAMGNKFFKRL